MSWNEQKGHRFEDLRKRQDALSDAERAELASLTNELEGSDVTFMDENTNQKVMLATTKSHDSGTEPSPQVGFRIVSFAGGTIFAFLLSVGAYIFAMGTALSWPLSNPNMEYALGQGAFWGIVGGLMVGLGASRRPTCERVSGASVLQAPFGQASVVFASLFMSWE